MALTTYSYVSGTTAAALTSAVTAAGVSPVGLPVERGTVLIQFVGAGSQDVGTVSGYEVISGSTPDELVTNVKAVLSDTLQPVGEPVTRGSALFQVMGKVTAESGSSSDYTLPAATGSSLGGVSIGSNIGITAAGEISVADASVDTAGVVKQLANIGALATDADAATIVTALNSLLTDAKTKGLMVADS